MWRCSHCVWWWNLSTVLGCFKVIRRVGWAKHGKVRYFHSVPLSNQAVSANNKYIFFMNIISRYLKSFIRNIYVSFRFVVFELKYLFWKIAMMVYYCFLTNDRQFWLISWELNKKTFLFTIFYERFIFCSVLFFSLRLTKFEHDNEIQRMILDWYYEIALIFLIQVLQVHKLWNTLRRSTRKFFNQKYVEQKLLVMIDVWVNITFQ